MAEEYRYKRVLLKLSGEALAGDLGYGIDPKVVDSLADEIADVVHDGVQLAIVVGGGNIFRGVSGATDGMDRAQADYIGMLATVMNALALQDACELDVDVLMKATKVDGVYDSDPVKNPDAKRYDRISYMEVLSQGLNVMDSTATSLCMDNKVPMIVFDLTVQGNIARALKGEDVGTTVE